MKNILIVEDSEEITYTLKAVLNDSYTVFISQGKEDALQLTKSEEIDVALIGLNNPLDEKLDLILSLIDNKRDIPILGLIDDEFINKIDQLKNYGVSDLLLKPFNRYDLKKKISDSLEQKENLKNSLPKFIRDQNISSLRPINSDITTVVASVDNKETELPEGSDETLFLNNLIAILAHKIKNPLVSIKTFVDLIGERFDDDEFRNKFYHLISKEIGKIDETVEDLITFSETSEPNFKFVDIVSLIDNIMNEFGKDIREKNISMDKGFLDGLPCVIVYEDQTRSVLSKILGWIIKEVPVNGNLKIGGKYEKGEYLELIINSDIINLSVHEYLLGLELILAQRIIKRNNGNMEITESGNDKTINIRFRVKDYNSSAEIYRDQKMMFSPGSDLNDIFVYLNYYERRQGTSPLSFPERRREDRRKMIIPFPSHNRRKRMEIKDME